MLFTKTVQIITVILCVLGMSSQIQAANAGQITEIDDSIKWESTSESDKIGTVSTWRREIPGADVKQFRGEIIIEHPTLEVLLTIDTPKDLVKWVYFCRASKGVPPNFSYMEYKGVWPVASRYVTVKSDSWIEDGVIYISSRNIDNAGPEPKNMVKLREFHNLFEITPLSRNTTKVRFTAFVDLGGRLPSWLANAISSRAPRVTLLGMRDLLDEGKRDFDDATVNDLSSVASPEHKQQLQALLDSIAEQDDSDPLDPNDD